MKPRSLMYAHLHSVAMPRPSMAETVLNVVEKARNAKISATSAITGMLNQRRQAKELKREKSEGKEVDYRLFRQFGDFVEDTESFNQKLMNELKSVRTAFRGSLSYEEAMQKAQANAVALANELCDSYNKHFVSDLEHRDNAALGFFSNILNSAGGESGKRGGFLAYAGAKIKYALFRSRLNFSEQWNAHFPEKAMVPNRDCFSHSTDSPFTVMGIARGLSSGELLIGKLYGTYRVEGYYLPTQLKPAVAKAEKGAAASAEAAPQDRQPIQLNVSTATSREFARDAGKFADKLEEYKGRVILKAEYLSDEKARILENSDAPDRQEQMKKVGRRIISLKAWAGKINNELLAEARGLIGKYGPYGVIGADEKATKAYETAKAIMLGKTTFGELCAESKIKLYKDRGKQPSPETAFRQDVIAFDLLMQLYSRRILERAKKLQAAEISVQNNLRSHEKGTVLHSIYLRDMAKFKKKVNSLKRWIGKIERKMYNEALLISGEYPRVPEGVESARLLGAFNTVKEVAENRLTFGQYCTEVFGEYSQKSLAARYVEAIEPPVSRLGVARFGEMKANKRPQLKLYTFNSAVPEPSGLMPLKKIANM